MVVHCRSRRAEAARRRDRDRARSAARARCCAFDVADRGRGARRLEADIEAHGAYYGVVCNAGIARDDAFPALTGRGLGQRDPHQPDGFYNVLHPLVMPMVRRREPAAAS